MQSADEFGDTSDWKACESIDFQCEVVWAKMSANISALHDTACIGSKRKAQGMTAPSIHFPLYRLTKQGQQGFSKSMKPHVHPACCLVTRCAQPVPCFSLWDSGTSMRRLRSMAMRTWRSWMWSKPTSCLVVFDCYCLIFLCRL